MLGLPKATELSRQLPKKAIYAKFNMNTAAKNRFDADISRSLFRRKKRRAQAATVAAAGEGAAPIPFADCALLIPTQISMIATITVLFGFDVNKSVITALLSSSIGAGGATLLGKTVVTNLIKLIPGAGTFIGGAISAATAGVIKAALGEAYIGIMELVSKGDMSIDDLDSKKGKETMSTLFTEQLKKGK